MSLFKDLKRATKSIKKNELMHMIFNVVTITILTVKSHVIFSRVIESPSSYPIIDNFSNIIIIYTLHTISIRQRFSHPSTLPSLLQFIMLNSFQILYLVYNLDFFRTILPSYLIVMMVWEEYSNRE